MSITTEKSAGATAIRPFHVDVPEEALTDLRRRIAATQWPERETVPDQSQGVPLAVVQELARLVCRVHGGGAGRDGAAVVKEPNHAP